MSRIASRLMSWVADLGLAMVAFCQCAHKRSNAGLGATLIQQGLR